VEDVFGSAAPEKARGRTITVLDLLASGEETIPVRFGRRPLAEASAWQALGEAHHALGRHDDAVRQFRRVVALRSRHLGLEHPETLAAEEMLVWALCPASIVSTRAAQAEPIARRVLDARRHVLGPRHLRTLSSMTSLAHVLTANWSLVINAESPRYPSGMVPDDVMRARGTPALSEALGLLRSALEGQVRALGPEHPESLATLDALGVALHLAGDFAGAVEALRRASDGNRRVWGPAHRATLQSLKCLGDSLRRLGRLDEAERLYLEVAERCRETFGPNHIQTSDALGKLFLACRRTKYAATMREVCERWLREILASPIDPDPYQRSQRGVRLRDLVLNLATLPATVPFDAALALRAA
jgi:tetratricopeptide (TPR) repeat protein